jgi:hypothetical protein
MGLFLIRKRSSAILHLPVMVASERNLSLCNRGDGLRIRLICNEEVGRSEKRRTDYEKSFDSRNSRSVFVFYIGRSACASGGAGRGKSWAHASLSASLSSRLLSSWSSVLSLLLSVVNVVRTLSERSEPAFPFETRALIVKT